MSDGSKNFSSQDILLQLDQCAEDFNFPVLDNGYIYPIDSRLTAYRDDQRWVLVIEIVGHAYRSGEHDGIETNRIIISLPGTLTIDNKCKKPGDY
jgi:hypothetical protein